MVVLHVNINEACVGVLERVTERRKITPTEFVRRAIAIYDLVERAAEEGRSVEIRNSEGELIQVVELRP